MANGCITGIRVILFLFLKCSLKDPFFLEKESNFFSKTVRKKEKKEERA
jgi:hypothetical protein